jgi:hypothetical protein
MPSQNTLEYQLHGGYIHHWLISGTVAQAVNDLENYASSDPKPQIIRQFHRAESGISELPVELAKTTIEGHAIEWKYYRCDDDHFVDQSGFYKTCHYLRTWAYAQIVSPETRTVEFELTSTSPADFWINGEYVHYQDQVSSQKPVRSRCKALLQEGVNHILLRFANVAIRDCVHVCALQVLDADCSDLPVLLPSNGNHLHVRRILEEQFLNSYITKDVYDKHDEIRVYWPQELVNPQQITLRIQRLDGRIYREAQPYPRAGDSYLLARANDIPDGQYEVIMLPRPELYYTQNLRIEHRIPFTVLQNSYSRQSYGTYAERRAEALYDAAKRQLDLYSEIAKMELGQWHEVKLSTVYAEIESINQRADCSDFTLIGLLGLVARHSNNAAFPRELLPAIQECALNFRYWMDQPGHDAMCFWSENHQILFHACEVLAGQLYPHVIFSNTKRLGEWHRQHGQQMARDWLNSRLQTGFREWDSNCYFQEHVLALSHLADLASDSDLRDLAAAVLDKLLFTLAVNSYQGVFGSTHGRSYARHIKGARREATAGISRLLWGLGIYNEEIRGTVSLASATNYELPPVIAAIANDTASEIWALEQHHGMMRNECDCDDGPWSINKVTFQTPDYMLSSAQDYRAGEEGYQQHIWQATLGHDAVVFVTHPPCLSEEGSHRPGVWHGNLTLPRVAQWHNSLIALYKLPDNDWLNFTHAYFPTAAFDQYRIVGDWAFAQSGNAYLALYASNGLSLTTSGLHAYRELRSYGQHTVWLCHLGRAAEYESFEQFQHQILNLRYDIDQLNITWQQPNGNILGFGWDQAFTLDGIEQSLNFPHYQNPYCQINQHTMLIRLGDLSLELDLQLNENEA